MLFQPRRAGSNELIGSFCSIFVIVPFVDSWKDAVHETEQKGNAEHTHYCTPEL